MTFPGLVRADGSRWYSCNACDALYPAEEDNVLDYCADCRAEVGFQDFPEEA